MNHPLNKFFALFAFLSTLAFATSAFAEDLYVAQTAAGSANGTSAANAYAVSFFNNSSNWAAGAGKISAGDTVRLVGTISTTLTVQGSGSSDSPITIKFEPGAKLSKPAWGTTTAAAIYGSSKNFITVDGANTGIIECTANGDGMANQLQSHGIYITKCANWEIKNLTIRNIYVHIYNTNNTVSAYTTLCIKASGSSNLSIHHNTLNNAYSAIYCLTESAITVTNTNIYNNIISACSTDIIAALGVSGSAMDVVNIYDNDISMGVNWFDTPNNNHVDGIHCWTSNLGDITNLRIFNNYIHGDCGGHCTGYIFLENLMTSPRIYNNLLVATNSKPAEAFIDISTHGGTKYIHNNTVIGLGTSSSGGIGLVMYDGASTTASVKNNLFKNLYVCVADSSSDVWDTDYNQYYSYGNIGYNGAMKATLSLWQALFGGDLHSILTNPLLNADYTIPLGSPSSTAGANLSSFFTTDKAGNARPASGPWSIGCYAAGASANPVIIPPSSAITAILVF